MDHADTSAPASVEIVTPPAAHTPGPWWACFGDDQPVAYYRGIVMYVSSDPHITVVTGTEGDKSGHICNRDEWEANARLIAAAPDLLEAASFLVDRIEQNIEWDSNFEDIFRDFCGHVEPAIGRMKTAIAKATHRPPDP